MLLDKFTTLPDVADVFTSTLTFGPVTLCDKAFYSTQLTQRFSSDLLTSHSNKSIIIISPCFSFVKSWVSYDLTEELSL